MKWTFTWSCLLLLGTSALALKTRDHENRGKCNNKQFRRNRHDIFAYQGVAENGIEGTTKNKTKLRLTAQVEVFNKESCDFYLKLSDVKVEESLGESDEYILLESNTLSDALSKHALRFKMLNGMIEEIQPSFESLKADVLNIQRGILSMLQMRQEITRTENFEEDVSGICPTVYRYHINGDGIVDDDIEHIEKIKDLGSCKNHQISRSNIDGEIYSDSSETVNSPVLNSSSLCTYKLSKKKKTGLKYIACKEHFLVQPFSTKYGAGSYVKTRTELERKRSRKLTTYQEPYSAFYITSIEYSHDQQHEDAKIPAYKKKVEELLHKLSSHHFHKSRYETAELFYDLVASFRHLDKSNIASLLQNPETNIQQESVRSFFFDALAQCGSPSCLAILFGTIKKLPDESKMKYLSNTLSALAFMKEPTQEVIRTVMGLHTEYKHPSALLVMSSLVHKLCRHRPDECNDAGTIGKMVQDVGHYLLRLLGSNCQTKDVQKQYDIFYALKAIGNIGKPVEAVPLIIDCIKNAEHVNISVAAVQAFRRMKLSESTIETFQEIFTDKNDDLEKRVAIFLELMKSPTEDNVILARDLVNDERESTQLRSFIYSYLEKAAKYNNPTRPSFQPLIAKVLKEYEMKEYNPIPTRYSKAFMESARLLGYAGAVDGYSIFHPESFVPRTINLNLTANMFGYSINALELNLRMEGLEMLLGKVVGDNGYLSKTYMNKIFEIPQEELKERQKRSVLGNNKYEEIDRKVNMKPVTPQALSSIRIFGNEIQVFTLEDIPLFNGELEDMNIIKELYELTKGKDKTFKRNMVLLEVSHSVPTMLGLPLKIGLNSSAVLTLEVKGKVETKNLLMGPKRVEIHGSLKPSISAHGSGKLSVECIGVGEIGTSFSANFHTLKQLHGKVKYEEGKEIEVHLNSDQEITDMFNISYDIYHVTPNRRQAMKGAGKVVQGRFCTDDVFNSSILFGSNTCMDVMFPNVYYNKSVSFFPLTGPLHVGLRNYPTDPLLKKYLLQIKREGGLYAITVSTPEAMDERKYTMSVGITKEDDNGIVGVLFGEEKKGIRLEYNYNNYTNEIETTISSNFTAIPLVLYSRYFNETDPATLNRYVGGNFNFAFGEKQFKQTVFYENTYQYWAFGCDIEYMPEQIANLYVMIQYEPQRFLLNFTHAPSNTRVLARTIPSLPLLLGELSITHGQDFSVNATGKLDVSNYTAEGSLDIKPSNKHFTGYAEWVPEYKMVKIDGNLNGIPISWFSKYRYDVKSQRNYVENEFRYAKNVTGIDIEWERDRVTLMYNNEKGSEQVHWKYTLDEESMKLLFEIGSEMDKKVSVSLDVKNASDLHTFCIDGFIKDKDLGYCLNLHHSDTENGIVVKMKEPEDEFGFFEDESWTDIAKLMKTTDSDVFSIHLGLMHYITIDYTNQNSFQNKEIKFDIFLMGVSINIASLQDTKNKVDFSVAYQNLLSDVEAFDYDFYYESPLGETGEFIYTMNAEQSETGLFSVSVNTLKDTDSWSTNVKVFNGSRKKLFSVLLKDAKSTASGNNDNTVITLHENLKSVKSIENTIPNILKYKIEDMSSTEFYKQVLSASYIGESFSNWENVASLQLSHDGAFNVQYFDDNPIETVMNNSLNIPAKIDKGYSKFVHSFIGNVLEIRDRNIFAKVVIFLLNLHHSYFKSLNCNGEEIYNNHIKGKIDANIISHVILKFFQIPLSEGFQSLIKNDSNTMTQDEKVKLMLLEFHNSANSGSVLLAFEEILKELVKDKDGNNNKFEQMRNISPKEFLLKSTESIAKENINLFQLEFLKYLQKIVSLLKTQYMRQQMGIEETFDKQLEEFTRDMPHKFKTKFTNIISNSAKMLNSWNYDPNKDISSNLLDLFEKFESVNFFDLFLLDYAPLIVNNVAVYYKLPEDLRKALKHFANDQNYFNFVSRISKFIFKEYQVAGSLDYHVNELLNTNSVPKYFENLSEKVLKKSTSLTADQKAAFEGFLKTRKIDDLIKEILRNIQERHNIPNAIVELLESIISLFNYNSQSINGITHLLKPDFLPNILKSLFENIDDTDLEKIIFKIIDIVTPKGEIELKEQLKSVLSKSNNLKETLYNAYKLSVKAGGALKKEQLKLYSRYLSPIEKITTKYIEYMFGNKDSILNALKDDMTYYLNQLEKFTDKFFPPILKEKSSKFTKKMTEIIQDVTEDELQENASKVLMDTSKEIFDEAKEFSIEYTEKYLWKELMEVVMKHLAVTRVGNQTGKEIYIRVRKEWDERLMFLIRLLNQFMASNVFKEKFIKGGTLQYYKIYQSIWEGNVSSFENIRQLVSLYGTLERRALNELEQLTGNYSTLVTLSNVISYLKSLNYTDINTVIKSYQGVHLEMLKNLSYENFIRHIKDILIDIGGIKNEKDESIDLYLKNQLPDIVNESMTAYGYISKGIHTNVYYLNQGSKYIQKGFNIAREYIGKGQTGENKFLNFTLELLVPGIDGLFQAKEKSSKESIDVCQGSKCWSGVSVTHIAEPKDLCLEVFMSRQGIEIPKNTDERETETESTKESGDSGVVNVSESVMSFAKKSELALKDSDVLRVSYESFKNSYMCDILNFAKTVQEMKKDSYFIYRMFDLIEGIALKIIDEEKNMRLTFLNQIKPLFPDKTYLESPNRFVLQELVFKISSNFIKAFEDLEAFEDLRRAIKQSIGLDNLNVNYLLQYYLNKQIEKISPKISLSRLENLSRKYIPQGVRLTRTHLQNISMIILQSIDQVKVPLSKFEVVQDPQRYLRSLTSLTFKLIEESLGKHEDYILSELRKIEIELKNLYKKFQKVLKENTSFAKYYLSKLQDIYKNITENHFSDALSKISKYDREYKKALKTYFIEDDQNKKLKKKLHELTRKSKLLQIKFSNIRQNFLNDIKENATRYLKSEKLSTDKAKSKILKYFENDNVKTFAGTMKLLQGNLTSIINQAIYPHFKKAVLHLDDLICQLKTNISKYYKYQDGAHQVNGNVKELGKLMEKLKTWETFYYQSLKNVSTQSIVIANEANSKLVYPYLSKVLTEYFENNFDSFATNLTRYATVGTEYSDRYMRLLQNYTGRQLDAEVEKLLSVYHKLFKKFTIKFNQDMALVPPTDLEKPLIKWLGLENKESEKIFRPLSRTAYLFGKSIVTFDGKAIFLPRNWDTTYKDCKYILTRDFLWKNFTLALHDGKLIVELRDGRIEIHKETAKVQVYKQNPFNPTAASQEIKEFPAQLMFTSVTMFPGVLKIHSLFGLTIYCHLQSFHCNVTVSGYYHNKTLGLFGTNNVESSDELKMPNGKLAVYLKEFIDAYQIKTQSKCMTMGIEEILGSYHEQAIRKKYKTGKCQELAETLHNGKIKPEISLRTESFISACSNEEATCNVVNQHINSQWDENEVGFVSPSKCAACSSPPKKIRYNSLFTNKKPKVHFTVVTKLTNNMRRARKVLIRLAHVMDRTLRSKYDLQYSLVARGGDRIWESPHIQTGNGKVFLDKKDFIAALESLQPVRKEISKRLGLAALKFAAEHLSSEQGSKIFLLLDDDASYSNSLREMMGVYNELSKHGVILNVVNKYKLKRNVLGKDSFGLRYHVRLPEGENIGGVTFPPPDDYMPLVKESGGAIFTLKAFVLADKKWISSIPTAVTKAIRLQIERDQKICKECKCNTCKNVLVDEHCNY